MMEALFRSDKEKRESLEEEEIRRRLHKAVTSYREPKEIHDKLLVDGQKIEEQIKAVEAENKIFTNTLKKVQQMETKRKLWKRLAQQETLMRNLEEENQQLKDKHEHLTAELFCLKEQCQKRRSAMQTFQLSRTVIQKEEEIEEKMKIIEDLEKEKRELRKQLSTRQEDEILAALQFQEESNTLTETQNMDEKDKKHRDKRPHQTEKTKRSWSCDCAKALWKGAKFGRIILGLLFLASISGIPDPACSPWSIRFDLLEPNSKISCRVPSAY